MRRHLCALLAVVVLACGGAGPETGVAQGPDAELLAALLGESGEAARAAVERIVGSGDQRYTSVFIELLRASQAGVAGPGVGPASAQALEALTGEAHGESWHAWVEWYARSELAPPPGFSAWKGQLLGRVDERFQQVLGPDTKSTIRVEEIVWGGVGFEGIPALDRPEHVAADEADYLGDDEPVFGIAIGDDARAYPQRILDWHEMANDVIGGVPISLAYCTLCGAGIAYEGEASDGTTYDFGSSGLLMRSNKLMVDRQTLSLWNQFSGRPVVGKLAGSDVTLERVPVVVTTWADWRARHPQTKVLSLDTGFRRSYHPGAAYAGYFASPKTMFPVHVPGDDLPRKARIYGVELGGVPKAYPVDALARAGVLQDRVGEVDLVLLAPRAQIEVDGEDRRGPARYQVGAPVRAYRTGTHRLRMEADRLVDAEGREFAVEESALVGPDDERLPRIAGVLAYWFAWSSYHPGTLVHGADSGS